MGPGQWADAGMYLRTVMLLLRAEGPHSCPQARWTAYRETVAEIAGADRDPELLCGLSIGYAGPDVRPLRTGRDALAETVRSVG